MSSLNPVTLVRNVSRNSPWIVMAVALHLLLLAGAMIFYTVDEPEAVVDSGIEISTLEPRTPVETLPEPEPVPRRPLQPQDVEKLVEYTPTWVIPTAPSDEPFGDPDVDADLPPEVPSTNTAIGVGPRGIGGRRPSPFTTIGPGVELGPGILTGSGGPPEKQAIVSVLSGLRWLARHQNEDGSWGAISLASRCDADHACSDTHKSWVESYDDGLTSLALLAFLGAGLGHESKQFFEDPVRGKKKVVTGEVVKKGLQWLVRHQNEDGSFGKDRPYMYNQALATMALCEAYGLTRHRYWREPAQRAVDYLSGAQRPSPTGRGLWGWRYASRQEVERFHQGDSLDEAFKRELYDADTSVTGWAVMALKSAQMSGLEVRQECFDGALAYAKWVSLADGQAGYIDPKGAGLTVSGPDDHFDYHPAGMSALSMCIRAFTAHDHEDPYLEAAAKRIAADLPRVSKDRLSVDYYYWYYGSLALNQYDGPDSPRRNGKYWRAWNKAMVDAVIGEQETSAKHCGSGGWLAPDRWCHAGGPVYATAINVLTLEVYYRYPNAFSAARSARSGGAREVDAVK